MTQRYVVGAEPIVPDYAGRCISQVVPALLGPDEPPEWFPAEAIDAQRTVLLVIDGLGWEQLKDREHLAPTLSAMAGLAIDSVCPTTTATALTSITTGKAPGEHGLIGYRMAVESEVLNVLRWSVEGRDVKERFPPEKVQPHESFCSQRPPAVIRAEHKTSGFTRAHLEGIRFNGFRVLSTLVTEVMRLLREHEPFVYAYYDGLDKVSHEYGLGDHYDAELAAIDQLVANVISLLPADTALVITADHGQVHVGDNVIDLHPEVVEHLDMQSGEGRFRWLHARRGHEKDLLAAAEAHHSDTGWIVTGEQMIADGWFGPVVVPQARRMLGDVALVAREDVAYYDVADTGPYVLVGRHGSMTSAEVKVPLLVGRT